ncbi:MAG: aminodeoxychorismate/anthranilate synthase component II [Flavobacteriia bacterium]|nr:aminodeoxychorismate/anthranilate synthase component II [Flavobacteriia bacterium]
MRILIIDFYDSFVYNLVHYFESIGVEVEVLPDAEIDLNSLEFLLNYRGIVLSPGPGLPTETCSMMQVIFFCKSRVPIFGVCLGMQGIGISAGEQLVNLKHVRHGSSSTVKIVQDGYMLTGLPLTFDVGLYHSWGFTNSSHACITAIDDQGVVMAMEMHEEKWYGVQFHPESIMTVFGKEIVKNVVVHIFNIFTKT